MRKVLLASQSPRRRELMMLSGIPFTLANVVVDEIMDPTLEPGKACEKLAYMKASAAYEKYPHELIVGADTIVVIDGEVLGKPADDKQAFEMLKRLSGRTHEVITGVAIIGDDICESFYETTQVTFYELSDSDILNYIKTKECHDKAGAYGIQGKGLLLVEKINGDYYNVVGLPMSQLYRRLLKYIEL